MAKHYILHFSAELTTPVDSCADAVLRYLISGEGRQPEAWPAHQFFSMDKAIMELRPLPHTWANLRPGDFVSEYWTDNVGPRSGVTLRLPGIKDLQGWFEALTFVDWICSMVAGDACVGYVQDEEDRGAISLLCASAQALYFKDDKVAPEGMVRFTTGEPWVRQP